MRYPPIALKAATKQLHRTLTLTCYDKLPHPHPLYAQPGAALNPIRVRGAAPNPIKVRGAALNPIRVRGAP